MNSLLRCSVVCILVLLAPDLATARPPSTPEPDPAVAAWFRSLRRDSDHFPCCDAADCRRVEQYKTEDGRYVVLARREDYVMSTQDAEAWDMRWPGQDEVWMTVPRGNVTVRTDNPTGKAILCYSAWANQIYCFVPWDYKS